MDNIFERLIAEPFGNFLARVLDFLPNIITSIIILLAGFIMAWLIKTIVVLIMRVLKVDGACERSGITDTLRKGGIRDSVSVLTGKVTYFITLVLFVIIAMDALYIPSVEDLISKFFLYLPNLLIAVVVVILGYMLGNFLSRAALIAAVNAGIKLSHSVSLAVKATVFMLSVSMALELLGIGKETILIAFAIVLGGVVLALSIAFGLGGKDAAREYLQRKLNEGHEEEEEEGDEDDIKHM